MTQPQRLRDFVAAVEALIEAGGGEPRILAGCREAMQRLVAKDDWLPAEFAKPHPKYYQQYLLHCDPRQRFSVVSFVWGPGQETPVHDHTVWGVIGLLRGGERCAAFRREGSAMVPAGEAMMLRPGEVDAVSPSIGDIHRVSNAYDDRVSVSIHAYGADIGQVRRHVFDLETGGVREFVSSYANA